MFKVIGLLISIASLALLMLLGGSLGVFLEPIALVVLLALVFGGIIFSYGNQSFVFFRLAYQKQVPGKLLFPALEFYNYLTKLTFVATIITSVSALIIILNTVSHSPLIGPALALSLLTCLYGLLLSYIVIQPIKHNIIFKAMSGKQNVKPGANS